MASSSQTQLSAATALVQLLHEHPDLADFVTWSIPRSLPKLHGFVNDGGLPVLAACVSYIGGTVVTDGAPYDNGGRRVQRYLVETTWRDTPVSITALVPLSAEAVAA